MEKRYEATLTGEVQGVFFRAFVEKHAQTLGLKGYVENLENGDLLVVVEGEESKIKELLKICEKGPPGAEVKDIKVAKNASKGEFDSFTIKY